MDIYLTDPLWQILVLLLALGFAFISVKKPVATLLFLPIILPFYLVKFSISLGFDFWDKNGFVIPTNLLEIIIGIFILLNYKLVWSGIKFLWHQKLGKYLIFSIFFLLLFSLVSAVLGVNPQVALGVAKSWFFLPIFLFFPSLSVFQWENFREKFLNFLVLGGITISLMSLPYILADIYTYDGRLAGIFLSPNHLAMALVPGILALFAILFSFSRRNIARYVPAQEFSHFAIPIPFLSSWPRVPVSNRGAGFARGKLQPGSRKNLLILILILELFVLYLTYSYGTWLALLIASLFIALSHSVIPSEDQSDWSKSRDPFRIPKRDSRPDDPVGQASAALRSGRNDKKSLFKGVLVGFLLLALLFLSQLNNPKLQHILNGDYYSSLHSRLMIWQSAWKISQDHWLFGIGGGNFQQAYLDYQKYFPEPYIEWAVPMPHNIFLAFSTQLGVFGLASFLTIIILSILTVIPSNVEGSLLSMFKGFLRSSPYHTVRGSGRNDKKTDFLTLWALSYLIYFLIHGLIDTPYWKNDLAIIFWLAIAVIWTASCSSTLSSKGELNKTK